MHTRLQRATLSAKSKTIRSSTAAIRSCRSITIPIVSMNGRDKFLDAYKISAAKRCWLKCKGQQSEIEHKYIGILKKQGCCGTESGVWPELEPVCDPTLI